VAGDSQPIISSAALRQRSATSSDDDSDRNLRCVAAAAPVLLWSAALSGADEWLSESWCTFTGLPMAELREAGWAKAIHPEDLERCIGIRDTSFAARAPFAMDVRLRRHDGEYRWMVDNGVPRYAADGAVLGFVGSAIDIHERKSLEESLAERTRALRLAERRQGQFLAMLSHELRNPLAPIANAASVLRTLERDNPILVRLREILDRQVGRLSHLVEELIDVTRAAQGQISLVRDRVCVEGIVQGAVARSHERLNSGHHRLDLDLDLPDERLYVRGDAARLSQALSNLIANSAKFTAAPGVISVSARQAAKTVHISVKDHGQGIDPNFLPHAFELFAQEDQTLARSREGLGVGLTLARRIARLHGGDVEAFSEGPGKGAEFIFWLPLLDATVRGGEAEPGPHLSDSCRVLIVEDNADALESLRLQMELWGNEVSTARSATEALSVAAESPPQIVLCDIGLPDMDGYRLVRALREKLGNAPVVFAAVTGYASNDDQERALAAGFDSFLVKPLQPESLARLLRCAANRAA